MPTNYSTNVYAPDYIICCDAGRGQFDANAHPYGWNTHMERSFGTTCSAKDVIMAAKIHHTSFLQAMRPGSTEIPSGDNEGHDHPPPSVIAASATTGFLELKDGDLVTPCTELGRSVDFGFPKKFEEKMRVVPP